MDVLASLIMGEIKAAPFASYLVAINALTFILFAIDYAIVCCNDDENTGLMNGAVLTLFAVVGGALGMFLALCLFTRGRMNKRNIAWWFSSIVCLIVWGMVVFAYARGDAFQLRFPDLSNFGSNPVLIVVGVYLLAINIVTFAMFVLDKQKAIGGEYRTPEAVLLGLSLLGGSMGGILGMKIAHHKTKKWYFTKGLPTFIVLHIGLFVFAFGAGLL